MILLTALALSAAPVPPTGRLTMTFAAPPEVHFNRRGDSTVTVTMGKTSQTVSLGGVPDPADPQNVYLRLSPTTLTFPAKFSGTVKLSARLFLCDARSGVCTVEEHQRQVQLRRGQQLDLTWRVGEDNR